MSSGGIRAFGYGARFSRHSNGHDAAGWWLWGGRQYRNFRSARRRFEKLSRSKTSKMCSQQACFDFQEAVDLLIGNSLYEVAVGKPSYHVSGWIVLVNFRLASQAKKILSDVHFEQAPTRRFYRSRRRYVSVAGFGGDGRHS